MNDPIVLLLALTALLLKHLVFDWIFQPPYMYLNKGKWGAAGGIDHSLLHAISSGVVLYFFDVGVNYILPIIALEFVIHYVTDWAKMNINRVKGWACNTHEQFWQLTGIDQTIHMLTYVLMLAICLKVDT